MIKATNFKEKATNFRESLIEILFTTRLAVLEEKLKSGDAMYEYLNDGCISVEPFPYRDEISKLGHNHLKDEVVNQILDEVSKKISEELKENGWAILEDIMLQPLEDIPHEPIAC